MHLNVKAEQRGRIIETGAQAIMHMLLHGLYPQSHWLDVEFARDIAAIRKANASIKARDESAFTASKRRGFWRIELA